MKMYNTIELQDKVVLEMDEDHVIINASDIILNPFMTNFHEVFINRSSLSESLKHNEFD